MFPISDSAKTSRFPILNFAVIIFTIYIFIKQLTAPSQDLFIMHYALIPATVNFLNFSTLEPFITAIFLHGGFLHIISNLWFLWIFGDNVEVKLGFILFPILYLGAGILGNFLQYILMPTSNIPMLGASGAIAGVLGAYYIFFPSSKVKTFIPIFGFLPAIINIPAPFMLGYWFILQIILGVSSFTFAAQGGIAFWAHIGGFVFGIIFAFIYNLLSKKQFIVHKKL
ncbi:rhomboid family intramembrane serine protease [Candidatus Microgenomates bacterium]|nr:MAG: rhomboid family intramembrane serine protease [Candidatus Microgenomates bacterium]